jgi:hypothetical protein
MGANEPMRSLATETAPQSRKNAAPAHRHQNAPRDHSGSRGLSLACPAFFVRHDGLLRIVSYANGRIGSGAA